MADPPADIPTAVASRLQELARAGRALAWLRIDERLALAEAGGDLEGYGLGALEPGAAAFQQAPFLEGLLPLLEPAWHMPSVEIGCGRVADLHFWAGDSCTWVLLLEVTTERNAAQRMQQKAYDMTLAQEREAALNRQLAEANTALGAAQAELERWNTTLEQRVAAQLGEIERVSRLKRFLAPSLANLIVTSGDESILESHRRDIAALFCDLRGFTAFAEVAEPEEVLELLHGYHASLVPLIHAFEGTLDRFAGDGLMVFFNDPLPCSDPAERAVRLAVGMREAMARLADDWRRRGHELGFGVGIAQGFATLGQIGFQDRFDYSAIGTVVNVAARLSDAAGDGQVLVTSRVAAAVKAFATLDDVGPLAIKGLSRPIAASNVVTLAEDAAVGKAMTPSASARP
jgi:class 3 adenylate cyclase